MGLVSPARSGQDIFLFDRINTGIGRSWIEVSPSGQIVNRSFHQSRFEVILFSFSRELFTNSGCFLFSSVN